MTYIITNTYEDIKRVITTKNKEITFNKLSKTWL